MAIAEKLAYLSGTKEAIRQAITDKGVEVPESLPFRGYADKIGEINTGGGTDPASVYKATRPADWLPMPTPQNNEIYMLFHIPAGASSLIAFCVDCTGGYTVECGAIADGAFAANASMTQTKTSGQKYENELFAADFSNITSDGMAQCMIKISGANITAFENRQYGFSSYHSSWNIVEIACQCEGMTSFICGGNSDSVAMKKLRYFAMYGENQITSTGGMFQSCSGLIAVLALYTGNTTSMGSMFYECRSLLAIPEMDTHQNASLYQTFYQCNSLLRVPNMNTQAVTNMNSTFNGCRQLTEIPALNTQMVTNMGDVFSSCYGLVKLPVLDISGLTMTTSMFSSCFALAKVTFNPDGVWASPQAIDLKGCSLMRPALVELFQSLPSIGVAKTLTIKNNPGAAELTEEDIAIATEKGWTLAT